MGRSALVSLLDRVNEETNKVRDADDPVLLWSAADQFLLELDQLELAAGEEGFFSDVLEAIAKFISAIIEKIASIFGSGGGASSSVSSPPAARIEKLNNIVQEKVEKLNSAPAATKTDSSLLETPQQPVVTPIDQIPVIDWDYLKTFIAKMSAANLPGGSITVRLAMTTSIANCLQISDVKVLKEVCLKENKSEKLTLTDSEITAFSNLKKLGVEFSKERLVLKINQKTIDANRRNLFPDSLPRSEFTKIAGGGKPCIVAYRDLSKKIDTSMQATILVCQKYLQELRDKVLPVLDAGQRKKELTPEEFSALTRQAKQFSANALKVIRFCMSHFVVMNAICSELERTVKEVRRQVDHARNPSSGKEQFLSMTVLEDSRSLLEPQFSSLVPEATLLVSQANMLAHVGQEGFMDVVYRLLTGIANMVGKLFSAFKIVYRAFKDLRRTEWQDYIDGHMATIARLKRANYVDVAKLKLPLPKGMKTTYVEATQKIIACLRACDMEQRSKSFANVGKGIYDKLDEGSSTSGVIAVLFEQAGEVEQINRLFQIYDKCFDKSSANQAEFSVLYKGMDEFSLECSLLSDNDGFLYGIHSVYKNLMECDSYMQKSLTLLNALKKRQDGVAISKEELSSLANACLFMAKTFDTYGLSVQDFHRVEHNHVEVCKQMTRMLKY